MGSKHETVIDDGTGMSDTVVTEVQEAADLRAIGQNVTHIAADELELRRLVDQARANGKSRGQIAIALGVTRQAAHERFTRS